MRLFSLTTIFFAIAIFTGCGDNRERAKEIVFAAKGGRKPSKDEITLVYKELKKSGSKLSENEVEELLNIHAALKNETDPVKRKEYHQRIEFLAGKIN